MIVYREFSSLQNDLGFSVKTLYSVSNSIEKHYRKKTLPKGNGETRTLYVPSEELKAIQRKITEVLLSRMDVSPYATAYRFGYGPAANAFRHVGHSVLLKLDIRHFFDSIIYSAVKKHVFPEEVFSEPIRILLSSLCTYKEALPQGAPSSPAVSNLILKEFDDTIGPWCKSRGIVYTRYCDDMTFSGNFDPQPVIGLVRNELLRYGFYLNDKKTRIVRGGQRKTVTGYVVNEKLNVSSDYRRQIRQEMHYCTSYGLASHMEHIGSDVSPMKYAASLLGRVNFVLTANPRNSEFIKYKNRLTEMMAALSPESDPTGAEPDTGKSEETGSCIVHVPCFGDVDIGECPTGLDPDGMDEYILGEDVLSRFIANNFRTFRKSGKNFAVCRGENSLAAIILIVDGIFHADFFESSKYLLCEDGDFWHTISEKSLGTDIRKSFPPFYISMLELFKELKLLYTNVKAGDDAPAAIVFPNYDKLISGWLPRANRKEILQRGIGLLAGEKNGMVLECLYGVKLSDGERVLGRICNYKNGVFTLKRRNGQEMTLPVRDCEHLFSAADRDPDFSGFFDSYIESIEEIELQVEYDRIGVGQENDGLVMRNGGYNGVIYKMK